MGNGNTAAAGEKGKGGKKAKGKKEKGKKGGEEPVEKPVEENEVKENKEEPSVVDKDREPPDPNLEEDENKRVELIPPDEEEEDGVEELVLPEPEEELPPEEKEGEHLDDEEEGEFLEYGEEEGEEEEEEEGEYFDEEEPVPEPAPKSERGIPVDPKKPKSGKKNEPVIDGTKPKSSRSARGEPVKSNSSRSVKGKQNVIPSARSGRSGRESAKIKTGRSSKSEKRVVEETKNLPKSSRSQSGREKNVDVPQLKKKKSARERKIVEEVDDVDDFEEEEEEGEWEEEEEEGEWDEEEEEGEWDEEEEEGEYFDIKKHLKGNKEPPEAEPQNFQSPTKMRKNRLNAGTGRVSGRASKAPSRALSEKGIPSAQEVSETGQSLHSSEIFVNEKRMKVTVETPNDIRCKIRKSTSNELKKLQFFRVENTAEPFMLILFEKVGAHVNCRDFFQRRQQKVESEGGVLENKTEKDTTLKNIDSSAALEVHFRLRFNNYFKYMWITVVVSDGLAVLAQYMYERRDQVEMSQVQNIVQTLDIKESNL